MKRWLSKVEEYGFALASGVPQTLEATEALVRRIGYVRQTIFGGMWDFTANLAFKDTAYTSAAIGPHTVSYTHLDVYKRQAQDHIAESEILVEPRQELVAAQVFAAQDAVGIEYADLDVFDPLLGEVASNIGGHQLMK